jgi:hypothetical protein
MGKIGGFNSFFSFFSFLFDHLTLLEDQQPFHSDGRSCILRITSNIPTWNVLITVSSWDVTFGGSFRITSNIPTWNVLITVSSWDVTFGGSYDSLCESFIRVRSSGNELNYGIKTSAKAFQSALRKFHRGFGIEFISEIPIP